MVGSNPASSRRVVTVLMLGMGILVVLNTGAAAKIKEFVARKESKHSPAYTPPQGSVEGGTQAGTTAADATATSDPALAQALSDIGFRGEGLRNALAVMFAEGGKSGARHDAGGSVDRGWFQFNSKWHPEVTDQCADDLLCAAKEALRVSGGGSNWGAWSTWVNGSAAKNFGRAQAAIDAAGIGKTRGAVA